MVSKVLQKPKDETKGQYAPKTPHLYVFLLALQWVSSDFLD